MKISIENNLYSLRYVNKYINAHNCRLRLINRDGFVRMWDIEPDYEFYIHRDDGVRSYHADMDFIDGRLIVRPMR